MVSRIFQAENGSNAGKDPCLSGKLMRCEFPEFPDESTDFPETRLKDSLPSGESRAVVFSRKRASQTNIFQIKGCSRPDGCAGGVFDVFPGLSLRFPSSACYSPELEYLSAPAVCSSRLWMLRECSRIEAETE